MIGYIIVGLLWLVSLPKILLVISDKVSLLGMYHSLKSGHTGDEIETFASKVGCVFSCNIALSLPFIIAYYVTLTTTIEAQNVGATTILSLSGLFTLVTLGMMRILANPTQRFFQPSMLLQVTEKEPERATRLRKRVIDLHKERIESFFFSFTSAAVVLLLISGSFDLFITYSSVPVEGSSIFFVSLDAMTLEEFGKIFLVYSGGLMFSTWVGEMILKYLVPLRQYPVIQGKTNSKQGKGRESPKRKKPNMV